LKSHALHIRHHWKKLSLNHVHSCNESKSSRFRVVAWDKLLSQQRCNACCGLCGTCKNPFLWTKARSAANRRRFARNHSELGQPYLWFCIDSCAFVFSFNFC
jgi:hypothetical protein